MNKLFYRKHVIVGAMLLCGPLSFAQSDDPVIMTVNGHPVLRSEFAYSYKKNNTNGVLDRKSVRDYVPLFINYKLKVEAAKDAHLDTQSSYKKEFAGYRDQQIRPAMIDSADIEAEARKIYEETRQRIDDNGGMVRVSHILIAMKQKATPDEEKAAKQRIDSVYTALQHGAGFAALAREVSQDPGSASEGGQLPWIVKGQTFQEFEDQVWSLKDGQLSKPFLSPAGWHIVLRQGHQNFYSYDSQRSDILRFIDQRNLREQIIDQKLDTLAKQRHTTPGAVLAAKREEMEKQDPNLKYLIQEYHDGLLLFAIADSTVWQKAKNDEAGLVEYFRKNRKRYRWDAPRFKGIAYCTRAQKDIDKVKKTVKRLPFSQWAEKLRATFNADSVLRIRVEKGIFRMGDNALVDKEVFGKDTIAKPVKDYPYMAVYGKKLKAPKEMDDVRELVVADYQDALEKEWVEQLRRKYPVTVNEAVVDTVK